MASRNPDDLTPEMQKLYNLFHEEMHGAGLDFILTCTYRSPAEQKALYAIGRTKPGKKVTWTLNSKHLIRQAFDIAMLKDGKITWLEKDYKKAGEIGMNIGLNWAGSWKTNKESCHFEYQHIGA